MEQSYRAFVPLVYVVFIAICSITAGCHGGFKQPKFVPYKAKVISYHTDRFMHGGIYCQNIKLDNNVTILANGISSIIDGQKIYLIDYVMIGDSITEDTMDIIYVHREGGDTYKFTYNPDDYRE